jgi:hypothetical protein
MVELLQEVRWKVKRCALRLQAGPGCPVGIEAQIKDAFAFVKAPISFFGAGRQLLRPGVPFGPR